jgi:hypothetical protein
MKLIFYYLALLNILDAVITYIGLQWSFIEEANPLAIVELIILSFL